MQDYYIGINFCYKKLFCNYLDNLLFLTLHNYLIGAVAYNNSHFGVGSGPIYMDNIQCSGSETALLQCSHATEHNCYHTEDAGVKCTKPGIYIIMYKTCQLLWLSQ